MTWTECSRKWNSLYCNTLCYTVKWIISDNEKLELKIIELESKLKSIESVLKCNERKLDKEFSKKETHIGKLVVNGQLGLLAELKEEILEIIND